MNETLCVRIQAPDITWFFSHKFSVKINCLKRPKINENVATGIFYLTRRSHHYVSLLFRFNQNMTFKGANKRSGIDLEFEQRHSKWKSNLNKIVFKCQQFRCFWPKNENSRHANSYVQSGNPWSKHPSMLAMKAQEFEGVFQNIFEKGE